MERTGFAVNAEEYYTIEQLYRVTSMSEEEFCREFKLVNDLIRPGLCRLIQEFGKLLEAVETENDALKRRNGDLADFLIGKAHAYEDTDFRKQAVELVGEREVVRRTVDLDLPLWEEDRKYLFGMMKAQE